MYFFKYGKIRDDFRSPGIRLAAKKLDYLQMNEAERRAYDDYLAYLGQEIGILEAAKIEGREEGREEGRAEEKKAIARNLLDVLDDDMISAKTGLSVDEVRRLRRR